MSAQPMTSEAERLREVIADAVWQTVPEGARGAYVARAICEELGISWKMVDAETHRYWRNGEYVIEPSSLASCAATLLTAAGVERRHLREGSGD